MKIDTLKPRSNNYLLNSLYFIMSSLFYIVFIQLHDICTSRLMVRQTKKIVLFNTHHMYLYKIKYTNINDKDIKLTWLNQIR